MCGAELPGADEKWRHYRSPNFDLYSLGRDKESREILHHYEAMRDYFVRGQGVVEVRKTPLTIFYFKQNKAREHYIESMGPGILSAFLPGPLRARVIMGYVPVQDRMDRMAFSHYPPHLLNTADLHLPPWAADGFLEVYAGTIYAPPNLQVGRPHLIHSDRLFKAGLLPLAEFFGEFSHQTEIRRSARLEAQGWLLFHYLIFGKTDLPAGTAGRLMDALSGHASAPPARIREIFERVVGLSCEEMDIRLSKYLRGGTFTWGRYSIAELPDPSEYLVREVSKEEITQRLDELSTEGRAPAEAGVADLEERVRLPNDPSTWEVLAQIALKEREEVRAEKYLTLALEKGSQSVAARRQLLRLRMMPITSYFEPDRRMPPERVEQLRREVEALLESDPQCAVAYEYLVWIEATAPKMSEPNLVKAQNGFSLVRDRHRTLLGFAIVGKRLGDKATALKYLSVIEAECEDKSTLWSAELLRANLEEREPDQAKKPPPRRPTFTPASPALPSL